MRTNKFVVLLVGAATLTVGGLAGAAQFTYQGLTYTDSACTTSFTIDASGAIACSGAATIQPTAAPTCNITQNPSFAQNGTGVTIFSACSTSPNQPTSYSWTQTPAGGSPTTVSTSSSYSPSTSLAPNTYTVALTASNTLGAATGTLSTTLTVTPPVAPPPVTSCSQSMATQAVDFSVKGQASHVKVSRGQAYAFKFTTDNSGRSGALDTAQSTIGMQVYRFLNLSEQQCDFSYTNFDSKNGCASTGSYAASVNYTLGSPVSGSCTLKPNTTYYLNVRNENPSPATGKSVSYRGIDSCPSGSVCGFVFGLN